MTYYFYTGKFLDKKRIDRSYRLPKTFEKILQIQGWKEGNSKMLVTFSDMSEYSKIKQYIDGPELLFLKHEYAKLSRSYNPKTYIIKGIVPNIHSPYFLKLSTDVSGGGQELYIVDSKEEIEKIINRKQTYVLQKSIVQPKLINGVKFDYRFFVLIVYKHDKINFYCYDTGLIRFATKKFNKQSKDIRVQATNSAIAMKFLSDKELYYQTRLFNKSHRLFNKFKDIATDTLNFIKPQMKTNGDKGFMLLGYDLIEDIRNNIFLIEINRRPSIYEYDDKYKSIIHKDLEDVMIFDLFKVAIEPLYNNILINENVNGWIYLD